MQTFVEKMSLGEKTEMVLKNRSNEGKKKSNKIPS